jgi:hypothetical protein
VIRLHPGVEYETACPSCGALVAASDWLLPGMRALGEFRCGSCDTRFLADLPTGHGLTMPATLDLATGRATSSIPETWFADWLQASRRTPSAVRRELHVEARRPVRRGLILDCLDVLYGHALLKLLTSERLLAEHPGLDLVVLVPAFLRWLVLPETAEVWTVDLPLREGAEWNDALAADVRARVETMNEAYLAAALPHPHPTDVDIERFTQVRPFDTDRWTELLAAPQVAIAWRDDRTWTPPLPRGERIRRRLPRDTRARFLRFAESLRGRVPEVRVAVAGPGEPGGFPDWIDDRRATRPDAQTERAWCELYAASHVAIGVHGSNMLLPSAHAGSVVDLMPADRWGNALQDLLVPPGDVRETIFRTRLLPLEARPASVAGIVASLLRDHGAMMANMAPENSRPAPGEVTELAARRRTLTGPR